MSDQGQIQTDRCLPPLNEDYVVSSPGDSAHGAGSAPNIAKWLLVATIFVFLVAPTYISYEPCRFQWDDAEYLERSVTVSQWFWSGRSAGIDGPIPGMVSSRPPVMTLMGLPWGYLGSWGELGKCFITLDAIIAFLAALSFYLLLRIGTQPAFLIVASACLFASLGPYPSGATAHYHATGFFADSLFAWTAFSAVLLIPYEIRVPAATFKAAVLRGVLWGGIFSLGVMTKLNFLYFVALIVPTLLWIRFRHSGPQNALGALLGFACCSAPSANYLVRWGQPAFQNLKASSFGGAAQFYYVPFLQFINTTFRESPGMLLTLLFMTAGLAYLIIKRRFLKSWTDVFTFAVMIGFAWIVFSAPNRQIRYAFPAIVALPFLSAILLSGRCQGCKRPAALIATGLVFGGLFVACLPTRHRPDRQSISRADAILETAKRCGARRILLATDSPTFNSSLMELSRVLAQTGAMPTNLAYGAMANVPIEADFRRISESDVVVFQDVAALSPPFTNQRVTQYEQFIRSRGIAPVRVEGDMSLYFSSSECLKPDSGSRSASAP